MDNSNVSEQLKSFLLKIENDKSYRIILDEEHLTKGVTSMEWFNYWDEPINMNEITCAFANEKENNFNVTINEMVYIMEIARVENIANIIR